MPPPCPHPRFAAALGVTLAELGEFVIAATDGGGRRRLSVGGSGSGSGSGSGGSGGGGKVSFVSFKVKLPKDTNVSSAFGGGFTKNVSSSCVSWCCQNLLLSGHQLHCQSKPSPRFQSAVQATQQALCDLPQPARPRLCAPPVPARVRAVQILPPSARPPCLSADSLVVTTKDSGSLRHPLRY